MLARSLEWHSGGHGFEPPRLHHPFSSVLLPGSESVGSYDFHPDSNPVISARSQFDFLRSRSTPGLPVPLNQLGFRRRDALTLVWPDSVSPPVFIAVQVKACPAQALA